MERYAATVKSAGMPSAVEKPSLRRRFSALARDASPALLGGLLHAALAAIALPGVAQSSVAIPAAFLALLPLLWAAKGRGRVLPLFVGVWLGQVPLWVLQQWWVLEVSEFGFFPLVAVQACWAGLFVVLLRLVRDRVQGAALPLSAAVLWAGVEFFRAQVFLTGYAWGLSGEALIDMPALATPARVGGLTLVAFLMMLLMAGLWRLCVGRVEAPARRWVGAACAGAAAVAWAAMVFVVDPTYHRLKTSVPVAVVQTNLPQSNKLAWTIADEVRDFQRFMDLTRDAAAATAGTPRPAFIVWPETMAPGITLEPSALDVLRRAEVYFPLPEGVLGNEPAKLAATSFAEELFTQQREIGVPMLVGEEAIEGLRIHEDDQGRVSFTQDKRYNSAYLIMDGVVQPERYDKIHLTPFGEIMPVISRWEWLEGNLLDLAAGGMTFDLAEGTRRTVFDIPASELKSGTIRIATPICFESTDPALCRRLTFERGARRADLIVNLTNDGWFGESDLARRQHLRLARWRAFELVTPVVRAANTGYSAVIADDGRVQAQLASRIDGVLRVDVGIHLGAGVSPYARAGEWAGWSSLTGTAFLAGWAMVQGRKGRAAERSNPA